MNLDELQSVQARERQSSDLQHLRSSFYREVGEYIQDLTERRAKLVEEADDPFSSPEVRQLSDDIETAEQTVEAVYERRVGKVVKKASIAAAGMPVDDDGLTEEEEALFDDLVERIERNREAVLSRLDGEGPSVSCSIDEPAGTSAPETPAESAAPDPDPEPTPSPAGPDGVSAADLMGSGADASASGAEAPSGPADGDPASVEPGSEPATPPEEPPVPDSPAGGSGEGPDETRETGGSDIPGLPRTTVRITADIGEVVGADDRDYELGSEDVVRLPEPNAEVLVEKDAAERLD